MFFQAYEQQIVNMRKSDQASSTWDEWFYAWTVSEPTGCGPLKGFLQLRIFSEVHRGGTGEEFGNGLKLRLDVQGFLSRLWAHSKRAIACCYTANYMTLRHAWSSHSLSVQRCFRYMVHLRSDSSTIGISIDGLYSDSIHSIAKFSVY